MRHKLSELISQGIRVAKQDFFEAMLITAGFLVPLVYAERTLGTMTITIIEPVMALLIIGFSLRARRETLDLRPTAADLLFAALALWSAISLPRAIDFAKSFREVLWLAECALVYYMVSHSNLNKESLGRLMRSWCYGAVLVSMDSDSVTLKHTNLD